MYRISKISTKKSLEARKRKLRSESTEDQENETEKTQRVKDRWNRTDSHNPEEGVNERDERIQRTKKSESESKGKPKGWSRNGIGVARNEIKGRERERGTRRRIIGRETLVIKLKKR